MQEQSFRGSKVGRLDANLPRYDDTEDVELSTASLFTETEDFPLQVITIDPRSLQDPPDYDNSEIPPRYTMIDSTSLAPVYNGPVVSGNGNTVVVQMTEGPKHTLRECVSRCALIWCIVVLCVILVYALSGVSSSRAM